MQLQYLKLHQQTSTASALAAATASSTATVNSVLVSSLALASTYSRTSSTVTNQTTEHYTTIPFELITLDSDYENGKQVLFTQQRFVVPPIMAQSGPYYEELEGEAEAAGFYESFYEATGGFEGMSDSEKDMF